MVLPHMKRRLDISYPTFSTLYVYVSMFTYTYTYTCFADLFYQSKQQQHNFLNSHTIFYYSILYFYISICTYKQTHMYIYPCIYIHVYLPVLSEQIVVAFPMVSQAANCLIEHLSLYIFLVLYANEIVTAKGKP